MTTSQMSLRIPVNFWLDDKVFEEFHETLKRIGKIREFAFFTHSAHTPPTVEQMAQYARILKQRMAAMRASGFHCGINNLCTLGHADEDLKGAEQLSGRLFTGLDGATTKGNFCPRDPQWLHSYIIPVYRMLAEAEPEFIWLDDDLRLSNHGKAKLGCFCDDCMKALADYFGLPGLDRPALQEYFETGTLKETRSKRLKMLEWNRHVLGRLEETIAQTVHAVNPHIIIGKMDSPAYWDTKRPMQIPSLQGPAKNPVWWRPGGNFYEDDSPRDALVVKMDMMGSIVATLPACVTSIQSEIENFPDQNLGKSTRMTCLETSAYCAAGCTGTTLNIIGDPEWSPISTYAERLQALADTLPFNDRIVEMNDGILPTGIWDGLGEDTFLSNRGLSGKWLDAPSFLPPWTDGTEFARIGLPRAFSQENSVCAMLCGAAATSLPDEALEKILSTGAYLDADAVTILQARGFGQLVGFRTGRTFTRDAIERTVSHPLNGSGFVRNMRQGFWGGLATEMIPESSSCRILSRLEDFHGTELAPCTSGCAVNDRGGRIAVSGYAAWKMFGYAPKYAQMHKLFRWLTHDSMLAETADCSAWTTVLPRRRSDGSLAVAILNLSFDEVPALTVRLRTDAEKVRIVRDRRADETIPCSPDSGNPAMKLAQIAIKPFELVYALA